jgi:hypothetical protein
MRVIVILLTDLLEVNIFEFGEVRDSVFNIKTDEKYWAIFKLSPQAKGVTLANTKYKEPRDKFTSYFYSHSPIFFSSSDFFREKYIFFCNPLPFTFSFLYSIL